MKSRLFECPGAFVSILLLSGTVCATTFYVDPRTGGADGNGSRRQPWKTLQEVIENGKIETREPVSHPYFWSKPLKTKNPGAPVKAGDTIVLRDGRHGMVSIKGAYNRRWITIAAEPGHHPTVGGIRFWGACQWRVNGLTVCPDDGSVASRDALVQLASNRFYGEVRDMSIEKCDIASSRDYASWNQADWAAFARSGIDVRGKQITVRDNRLTAVDFGIAVTGDSNLVENNSIIHFMSDALRGIGDDLTFKYNYARNCYAINDNHDDGFQSWSRGSDGRVGSGTVYRVKIIGNVIINSRVDAFPFVGHLQGIGCFDGMAEDWTIADNIVVVDQWHGITLMGAVNCRITGNTVCPMKKGPPGPPWIRIGRHKNGTPSKGCVVSHNLTTAITIQDPMSTALDGNAIFSNPDNVFVDFARFDLRVKPGGPRAGAGREAGLRAASFPPETEKSGASVGAGK